MNTVAQWPGLSWYQAESASPGPVARVDCSGDRDIVIIGGGLAGLGTALSLAERGVQSISVLEAGEIGHGASGRNAGFVFAGYSLDNLELLRQLGPERAARLHGWTRASVRLIRRRIDGYGLECQANDAGVVLADWFGDDERLKQYCGRMQQQLGFELQFVDRERLGQYVCSKRYGSGLLEPHSFHFNPYRHVRELARILRERGVDVLEHQPVRAIERSGGQWRVDLDVGHLRTAQVVLATGGYDRGLCRAVQSALQPIATYIAVTEPLTGRLSSLLPRPVAVYDSRFAFDYFRPLPDDRLLWGGRISVAARSPKSIRRILARDLARVFPSLGSVRFDHAWGGWMSYARHQMPLLGRTESGLWYALAFGGHGMATTTLAGEIMAEAIGGQSERLAEFERWPPRWAGGSLGRLAVQGRYWQLQAQDWWRARHRRVG